MREIILQSFVKCANRLTFREQACLSIGNMPPEIPSIAEVVIFFYQYQAIPFGKTKLIWRASNEFVCKGLVSRNCNFVRNGNETYVLR